MIGGIMSKQKSDDDFFAESIQFFYENGEQLQQINSDCVDEYNDHSLLKLICITYWVGIFSKIAHKQLKERFGYDVIYIDTMAGSGVTSTKRARDFLCGSSPGAVLSARNKGCPFDVVICIDINKQKADALEKRLKSCSNSEIIVYGEDIKDVSEEISKIIQKKRTVTYTVIDPQALKGLTWSNIYPLLCCKGDVMITWFEAEAMRARGSALSKKDHKAAQATSDRLTELFGSEQWKSVKSGSELTDLFVNRIKKECGKTNAAKVRIERSGGNYYLMILLTGEYKEAEKLSKEWRKNVNKRILSAHGKDIASLLDIKAKRKTSLDDF
jgi:three-Cys-motif partner protein